MAKKSTKSAKKVSSKSQPNYWLFKSEPTSYSIDDLAAEDNQTTCWDGIRNYQVRNMIRDEMQKGDHVLFYYSNAKPLCIVGTMEIVKTAYADHTAFDPKDHHYDEKSDPENPRWFMVDVKLAQIFPEPVTRESLGANATTSTMQVLKKGSRLSVVPVTAKEWKAVHKLAGVAEE